ncbi:MAG: hypothetical protein M5U26_04590 [Planctomycetota bacterium]|nr:hypothetical protein [Planctomycetota bacterium]
MIRSTPPKVAITPPAISATAAGEEFDEGVAAIVLRCERAIEVWIAECFEAARPDCCARNTPVSLGLPLGIRRVEPVSVGVGIGTFAVSVFWPSRTLRASSSVSGAASIVITPTAQSLQKTPFSFLSLASPRSRSDSMIRLPQRSQKKNFIEHLPYFNLARNLQGSIHGASGFPPDFDFILDDIVIDANLARVLHKCRQHEIISSKKPCSSAAWLAWRAGQLRIFARPA